MGLVLLPVMFLLMYLLVFRPQQKRMKEQRDMVARLTEGDEVLTSSGVYGVVTAHDDEDVWLEIAEGVEVRIAKGAVLRITRSVTDLGGDDGQPELAEDDADVDVDLTSTDHPVGLAPGAEGDEPSRS